MVNITLEQLTKTFGATTAVDAVSLNIPAGSLFFLLGPSGCGKTTLLRMIAGFIMPSTGRVLFGDQDMTYVPPYLRETGMVFQSYALWPHMTVAENIAFGLDVRKTPAPERAERLDWALSLVQLNALAARKPNQLSGGQQQRVALARALAIKPRCLLLDEPLSNLDAKLRLEMRGELKRIVKETRITAIYVTHDQKEALSMADGIAVLKAGRLEQTGSPTDLYCRPNSRFVADFIGESNFLPGTIESISGALITIQTPVGQLQCGRPPDAPQLRTWKTGQKVLAAFRPESLTLLPNGSREPNALGARRLSTLYLGELAEHVVALADGQQIKVFELNPQAQDAPSPDARHDMISVRIPPEQVMLVPAE